jgi:hypothetical protein
LGTIILKVILVLRRLKKNSFSIILYFILFILINYWPFIQIISVWITKSPIDAEKRWNIAWKFIHQIPRARSTWGATSWMWNKREDRNHPISFPILISGIECVSCQLSVHEINIGFTKQWGPHTLSKPPRNAINGVVAVVGFCSVACLSLASYSAYEPNLSLGTITLHLPTLYQISLNHPLHQKKTTWFWHPPL